MISHSPTETSALGRSFSDALRPGDVLALCGDLGAGKTHFVKGLAEGLGCDPTAVTSPTFTLINEYTGGRLPLYHFDLYRIESEDELIRVGLDDYLDSGGILAIEWAEKFPALLPRGTRWLYFRHHEDGSREIEERTAPL
ncbi:tRNA (adenosine(37)-N6)-threonylcarbamoyltransferase complex ATPase subunit type 1 TsaE [Verrucomicrobiota bacterium sgz303538]